jgi:MoaA/NifB/PqqE/SkfB family radical SAM enzyme
MGVKKFLISGGGEPLCEPHKTFEIMKTIKLYRAEGRIITNGVLWTKSLIEKTIKMKWDTVVFSLHGSVAQTHDYLTSVKGSFQRVIKNLETFRFLKKKIKSSFPSIEFTFVLNKLNFKEVPQLLKIADELEVESINIEPMTINNKICEKIKLDEKEKNLFFNKILPQAEKIASKLKIRNNFSKLREVSFIEKVGNVKEEILNFEISSHQDFFNIPCYEPWLWPKIEANGEVWPCSTVQLRTTNIKKTSFRKIWFGKEFEEFRKKILNKDLPEECKNCVLTHIPLQRKIREELRKYSEVNTDG